MRLDSKNNVPLIVRVIRHMVPEMGLEPIWISPFDFKSNAYTNSATRALLYYTIITSITQYKTTIASAQSADQNATPNFFFNFIL